MRKYASFVAFWWKCDRNVAESSFYRGLGPASSAGRSGLTLDLGTAVFAQERTFSTELSLGTLLDGDRRTDELFDSNQA